MKSHTLFLLFAATCPLAAEKFCFENVTPKAKSVITFDSERNRITEGVYKVSATEGEPAVKSARFHGTKSGTVYAITFKGKVPYKKPKGDETIVWTRNGNNLEVAMYGTHPKTGKKSEYQVTFATCKK